MFSIKIKDTTTSEIKLIDVDTQNEHVLTMVLSAARSLFNYGPQTL